MFHTQTALDKIVSAARVIQEESVLARPDDSFAELLFQVAQYAQAVEELTLAAQENLYESVDPQMFDLTELRVFRA